MSSKRNKLLIFLGLLTIAVSKSHNQRFDNKYAFESQRTSASDSSANSPHKEATQSVKFNPQPRTINDRGYHLGFSFEDPSKHKTDELRKRVIETDHMLSPLDRAISTSKEAQFSRRFGSVPDESNDHSKIDPEDFYFEPQKIKDRRKPLGILNPASTDARFFRRRTGILIADTGKASAGEKTETLIKLTGSKDDVTTKNNENGKQPKDSPMQSDKKNTPKKKKLKRKKVLRVRARNQNSNKTRVNNEKHSLVNEKVKLIDLTTSNEQKPKLSTADKVTLNDKKTKHPIAIKMTSNDPKPKHPTVVKVSLNDQKPRHSTEEKKTSNDKRPKHPAAVKILSRDQNSNRANFEKTPPNDQKPKLPKAAKSSLTEQKPKLPKAAKSPLTEQKPKHPTVVKFFSNKDEIKNTESKFKSSEIPTQKHVLKSNENANLKQNKFTQNNGTSNEGQEKKVTFFRRSGPKNEDKTELKTQNPEKNWMSTYGNENQDNDDSYYVRSFNYMGDNQEDVLRIPQTSSPQQKTTNTQHRQTKIPLREIGEPPSGELDIGHLEEIAGKFLNQQITLVKNNAGDQTRYNQPKKDFPSSNADVDYYDKTSDISEELSTNDKSFPEKELFPAVTLKKKKIKQYKEPVWKLQSQKKKFSNDQWKQPKTISTLEGSNGFRNEAENGKPKTSLGRSNYYIRSYTNFPLGDTVNSNLKDHFPTGELKAIINQRKPLLPLENKGDGNFFMMYNKMGNIENFANPGNIGYLSSLKLTWTDDDTRARVEEAVDSRAFLSQKHPHLAKGIGSIEDASRESLVPQQSENIMKYKPHYVDDFMSSLEGDKSFYFQDVPIVHRQKRFTHIVPRVTSHFQLGESNVKNNYTLNHKPRTRIFSKRVGQTVNGTVPQDQHTTPAKILLRSANVEPVIKANRQVKERVRAYFLKPAESRGIQQLKSTFNITDIFDKYEKPSRDATNIQIFRSYQTPNRGPKQGHNMTYFHSDKHRQTKIQVITDKVRSTSRMDTLEQSNLNGSIAKNATPLQDYKTMIGTNVAPSSTELRESYLKPDRETASKILAQNTVKENASQINQAHQQKIVETTPIVQSRTDKTTTKPSIAKTDVEMTKPTIAKNDVEITKTTTARKYIEMTIAATERSDKTTTVKSIADRSDRTTTKPTIIKKNKTTAKSKILRIYKATRKPKATRQDRTTKPTIVKKNRATTKPKTAGTVRTTTKPLTTAKKNKTITSTITARNDLSTPQTTTSKNYKSTPQITTARNDKEIEKFITAINDKEMRKLIAVLNDKATKPTIAVTSTKNPETFSSNRFYHKAGDIKAHKEHRSGAASTVEARRVDDKTWLYPKHHPDDEIEDGYHEVGGHLQNDVKEKQQIKEHQAIHPPPSNHLKKSSEGISPLVPFEWHDSFTRNYSPEVNYPTYHSIPKTHFTCKGKISGYYADSETGCQVFHMCHGIGVKHSFLCPNTTIFNQRLLVCDYYSKVHCENSESLYEINNLLYNPPKKANDYRPQPQKSKNSQQNPNIVTTKYSTPTTKNYHQNDYQLTENGVQSQTGFTDMPHFIVKHFKENIPNAEFERPKSVSKSYSTIISEPKGKPDSPYKSHTDGHYLNEKPLAYDNSPDAGGKLIPDTFADNHRAIKNSWNANEMQKTLKYELSRVPEQNHSYDQKYYSTPVQERPRDERPHERSKVIIPLIKKDNSYYVPNLQDEFRYLKNDDVHIAGRQNEKVIVVNKNRLNQDYDSSESQESTESDKYPNKDVYQRNKDSTKNEASGYKYGDQGNQNPGQVEPRRPQYIYPLPGVVQNNDGSREFNYGYRVGDPNAIILQKTHGLKHGEPRLNQDILLKTHDDINNDPQKMKIKMRIADIKSGVESIGKQAGKILGGNENSFKNVRIFKLKPDGTSGELEEIRLKPFTFERQSHVPRDLKQKDEKREEMAYEFIKNNPRAQKFETEIKPYMQMQLNDDKKKKTKIHSNFQLNNGRSYDQNIDQKTLLAVPKLVKNVMKDISPKYTEFTTLKQKNAEQVRSYDQLVKVLPNNVRGRIPNVNDQTNSEILSENLDNNPIKNIHKHFYINPGENFNTNTNKNLPPRETFIDHNVNFRIPPKTVLKETHDKKYESKYSPFIGSERNENSEHLENIFVPKQIQHERGPELLHQEKMKFHPQKDSFIKSKQIQKQNSKYNLGYIKDFPNSNSNINKPINNNFNGKFPETKYSNLEHNIQPEMFHQKGKPQNDKRTFIVFSKPKPATARHYNFQPKDSNNYQNNNLKTTKIPIFPLLSQNLNHVPNKQCDDSTSNSNSFTPLELGKNGPQKQLLNEDNLKVYYHSQDKSTRKCRDSSNSQGQSQDSTNPESEEILLKKPNLYTQPTSKIALKELKRPEYTFGPDKTSARFNSKTAFETVQLKSKPVNLFELQQNSRPAFTKPITAIPHVSPEYRHYYQPQQTIRKVRPNRNFQNERARPVAHYQQRDARPVNHYQQRDARPVNHNPNQKGLVHSGPFQDDSRSMERSKRVVHGKNSRFAELEKAAEMKATMGSPMNEKKHPIVSYPAARTKPQGKIMNEQKNHSNESHELGNHTRHSRYAAMEKAAELKAERMMKSKSKPT